MRAAEVKAANDLGARIYRAVPHGGAIQLPNGSWIRPIGTDCTGRPMVEIEGLDGEQIKRVVSDRNMAWAIAVVALKIDRGEPPQRRKERST